MKKVRVTTSKLNVRKTPHADSEILRVVSMGNILEYTSMRHGWVRLKGTGYVMEQFVAPVETE